MKWFAVSAAPTHHLSSLCSSQKVGLCEPSYDGGEHEKASRQHDQQRRDFS